MSYCKFIVTQLRGIWQYVNWIKEAKNIKLIAKSFWSKDPNQRRFLKC